MKEGQEYLEALKLGSEKAFRKIMDCWYKRLFNFANGYLNNQENTKEVLQDVFLKLWDNRHQLAENTVLNAYLFTLTRNRCIDLVRRERLVIQFKNDKQEEYLRLSENFDALSDPILDNIFAREVQNEVNRAVTVLPAQCRKIFILSRSNGMKNKDISKLLNLTEKTIESHLTKALKTIRQALEQKFPGSLNLILIIGRFQSAKFRLWISEIDIYCCNTIICNHFSVFSGLRCLIEYSFGQHFYKNCHCLIIFD